MKTGVSPTRFRANIERAAKTAGVSRRTIYNWIWAGKVDYDETPYGVLVYLDSLPRKEVAGDAE